jgi:hypothetical protein
MVDDLDSTAVVDSYPENATTWSAHVDNGDPGSAHNFTVFVVCVRAAAAG